MLVGISDVNKNLLIESPDITKMLIEGLLLDPLHIRQNQELDVRNQIQCDAAECFAQLAVYRPARDFLQADPAVLDAMRALASRASTEAAKQSAEAALMSLDPPAGPVHQIDAEKQHVMMSCACAARLSRVYAAGYD